MRKKTGRKGSLFQEPPFQMVLLFVSFILLALLISRLFAGAAIQDKICQAVPWLCGARSDVNYAASERSAEEVTCAIGSAWTKGLWQGGQGFNCQQFYQAAAAGTGKSGVAGAVAVTGAASSPMTLSQATNLQPSVSCSGNKCTVKNFVMPQDVVTAEDWIPYWGDPHYLTYWGSFPQEEDTWNFQIHWWHHVIIGAVALLPAGKTAGLGLKAFLAGLKGPGKEVLGGQAAKAIAEKGIVILENKNIVDQAALKLANSKMISDAQLNLFRSFLSKGGREVTDNELAAAKTVLSKFDNKDLSQILKTMGERYGRTDAIKDLMRRDLVQTLSARIKKPWDNRYKILGTFAIGEAGLYALADSMMNKYNQVGNAVAIKNPGNKAADTKTFNLPDDMKGKPVLVKWKPKGGETQIKNAHFASPCYLDHFNVSRETIVCDSYSLDQENRMNTTCVNQRGVVYEKAPIMCGQFSQAIDNTLEMPRIYDTTQKLLKMKNKDIFETNDDTGKLTKLYLPWFLSADGSSPKYYLEDFQFSPTRYAGQLANDVYTRDIALNEKIDPGHFWAADVYMEKYTANLSCGEGCMRFKEVGDLEATVMRGGKSYVLDVYSIELNPHVGVDIYDVNECTNLESRPDMEPQPYHSPLPCDRVKNGQFPWVGSSPKTVVKKVEVKTSDLQAQINEIKSRIYDVNNQVDERGVSLVEYYITITPAGDIKAKDVNRLGGTTAEGIRGCGSGVGAKNCFRVFSSDKIEVKMACGDITGYSQQVYSDVASGKPPPDTINEICEIKVPSVLEKSVNSITLSRQISLDKTSTIYGITYSTLSFEPKNTDGKTNYVFVEFGDSDGFDGAWDEFSVYKKPSFWKSAAYKVLPTCIIGDVIDRNSFKIKFSDVDNNGNYKQIESENCNIDGVVITFDGDQPSEAKISTGTPNYCMREVQGFFTRTLSSNIICGVTIKGIAATAAAVGAAYVSGGATVGLLLLGAAAETLPEVGSEYQQIWPGKSS